MSVRVSAGLMFHRASTFNVGGYVSYSSRFMRGMALAPGLRVEPLVEPQPRPAAEHTAPHLRAFSPAVEALVGMLEERLRRDRTEVCHVMEWGAVGTALFEACLRAGVPYVIVVIDHKPVCAQSMLLERGETVCTGPESAQKCRSCMLHLDWSQREATLKLRHEALAYYFRRAAAVITFTEAHADEIVRWLGRPRSAIDVVPIAVPPPGAGYAKAPSAFSGPLRIGFVGRTCPEWGIELVLEAWRALAPDPARATLDVYTCHLFAEHRYDRKYADLIARGSVRVSTEPVFNRLDHVHEGLAALVVASQWKNNNSGAGLEALVRGTPVITSDRYAFFETLPAAQRELAYAFGDVEDLTRVLRRVIAEPAILERLSQATAPSFTEADHLAGVAAVLRRAAGVVPGPPARLQLSDDERPSALVVADAQSAWLDVVDAYLDGSADLGSCLAIAICDDAASAEEALLERVERHGFSEASCPDLALLELVDAAAAIPSAARYIACGAHDEAEHLRLAACCGVPIVRLARSPEPV